MGCHCDGCRFLDVALALATQVLHIPYVAIVRACRGIHIMLVLKQHSDEEVVARRRGPAIRSVAQHTPQQQDPNRKFPAHPLSHELEEVDIGSKSCKEVCFIQFLSVGRGQVGDIIPVASDIFLLAGAGARNPRVTANGPVEDDAPATPLGSNVDIALWHPPTNQDYLNA